MLTSVQGNLFASLRDLTYSGPESASSERKGPGKKCPGSPRPLPAFLSL